MGLVIRHHVLTAPAVPAFVWPDATNTGAVGTPVATYATRQAITASNVTITDVRYDDGVIITGNNVTLRNCWVNNGGYFGIEADTTLGLTVDRCTVVGTRNQWYNLGIGTGGNAIVTNCDVSNHQHAIAGGSGVSLVKYNYIHDAFLHPDPRPVTFSIGSPCTATLVGHGYVAGDPISFNTTGTLPSPLIVSDAIGDRYWVIAAGLTADTFRFSASGGGPAINTSGTQSGVHSVYSNWDKHVGGVSIKGGQTDLLVEDNFIYGQDTTCIFCKDDFAPVTNVRINHNKCMNQPGKAGPGYQIQVGAGTKVSVTNCRVTNNFMEKGGYGHVDCSGTTDITFQENNWSYTLNRYLLPGE